MFQELLSCPSGECAWCYPDLTRSMTGDYCGKHEASYWYFQNESCLTGGKEGWLENQPGWGRRDRKCWGEHPQSIDILEVLNSRVLGSNNPSSTAVLVCSLDVHSLGAGADPACLGTCAFVSLSYVWTWCRYWFLRVEWDVNGCSSVPQYWLLEYTSRAPSGPACPGEYRGDLNKEGKEAAPAGTNWESNIRHGSLWEVDLIGVSVSFLFKFCSCNSLSLRGQYIQCVLEWVAVELKKNSSWKMIENDFAESGLNSLLCLKHQEHSVM